MHFPSYRFPIHCAVMGGSLELVKWMVESHDVPISVRKTKTGLPLSVQTSKSRTLIDLAMTGRPKIDILGYLVSKNLSVIDCKDQTLASKTLQTLLRAGYHSGRSFVNDVVDGDLQSLLSRSSHDSVTTLEDACIICCEKTMDCVLTPCGHQVCCSDCGSRLQQCPVCKTDCVLVRIRKV
jgi:Zinc finger, C3HC4 type (RING finger)